MIQENAQPAAPVQHFVHTPGPWEVKGPTIRANADLIALAPEMWQAIQGALRIADLWRPSEDTPEEHWEEAKALYMMLSQFEEIARKVV